MPRPPASTAAWTGTPPVIENGFAFANGDFFADSSNQNRHRRATPGELKEHFDKGTDKDHPVHWFEAQLIHYGLQPSKTKSVARMRLFDAVKSNALAVPPTVSKLEAKLKKEWNKNDREAKKAHKDANQPKSTTKAATKSMTKTTTKTTIKTITKTITKTNTTPKTTTTKKRKATDDATITTVASKPAAKRAKATVKPKEPKVPSASNKTATPKIPAKTKIPSKMKDVPATTRKPQTARRGGVSQGPSRGESSKVLSSARADRHCSGSTAAQGRIPGSYEYTDNYDRYNDDDDNSRNGYGDGYYDEHSDGGGDDNNINYGSDYSAHSDAGDQPPPPYTEWDGDYDPNTFGENVELEPLGLLNGRYNITGSGLPEPHGRYASGLDIRLVLHGTTLRGTFDFGHLIGVLYFPERPWRSSHEPVPFKWRGDSQDFNGGTYYGNQNDGYIKFLGGGRIEGRISFRSLTFTGERLEPQAPFHQLNPQSALSQWEEYE